MDNMPMVQWYIAFGMMVLGVIVGGAIGYFRGYMFGKIMGDLSQYVDGFVHGKAKSDE